MVRGLSDTELQQLIAKAEAEGQEATRLLAQRISALGPQARHVVLAKLARRLRPETLEDLLYEVELPPAGGLGWKQVVAAILLAIVIGAGGAVAALTAGTGAPSVTVALNGDAERLARLAADAGLPIGWARTMSPADLAARVQLSDDALRFATSPAAEAIQALPPHDWTLFGRVATLWNQEIRQALASLPRDAGEILHWQRLDSQHRHALLAIARSYHPGQGDAPYPCLHVRRGMWAAADGTPLTTCEVVVPDTWKR